MLPFYDTYLRYLEQRHADILQTLEGLPPDALDWVPGPGMNSIAVLIFHLTGAERYWIGDVVAQQPSGRDREAEFKVHDVGAEALRQRLAGTAAYIRKVLEGLTMADLDGRRTVPRNGQSESVASALLHALEHMALHVGNIQITRQWWDLSHKNP